jgi:crotonobetainyl-CoA:carnitine CoA-transferase CaiB-like acyl-CoA transferase
LIARAATGEGADIRVSMFDVMADWLAVPLLHQEAGKAPRRIGLAHPSIVPYGVFTTGDAKEILIAIQSDREWAKFSADFLKNPAASRDERFSTNVARVRNRDAVNALIAAAFAALDEAAAKDLLTRADVAFASVNDMAALSAHPHLRRITVETAAGPVSLPAPAPAFKGAERTYGPVPDLGQHRPG